MLPADEASGVVLVVSHLSSQRCHISFVCGTQGQGTVRRSAWLKQVRRGVGDLTGWAASSHLHCSGHWESEVSDKHTFAGLGVNCFSGLGRL